jgi:hypothetical protein
MGTLIPTRGSNFLPSVQTTTKKGLTFTGKYVSKREGKFGFGNRFVYEFEVLDGDMPIQRRNEQKEWAEVDVDKGDHVEILGNTRLSYAFNQLSAGAVVTIKYLGLGQKPKRGGNAPHEYEVEVG